MYDPAEWSDPMPGTGDNSETDSDAKDSGRKREHRRHASDHDAGKADAKSGKTYADTRYTSE